MSDRSKSTGANSNPLALDFDHHIHTIYSGHSGPEMFVPAIMSRCTELGLKRIVIVEHIPAMMNETFTSFDEWLAGRDERTVVDAIRSEVAPRRKQYPDIEVLVGAEIDYTDGIEGSQFVIRNPNATTTCGCGSSFSP